MNDLIKRQDALKIAKSAYDGEIPLILVAECIEALPSAESEQTVYCMDCAKSAPLDEHGALWYCKAHDRTTLRHSYCNNGEHKCGDDE